MKSPNDVARCLARDTAGSVEAFAELMNQKARAAGRDPFPLSSTPTAFRCPANTRPRAIFRSSRKAAYANRTIRSIVCLPQIVFRYANGRTRELENTNKVLKRLPYCNGMKTGYTEAAGHCLIASGADPAATSLWSCSVTARPVSGRTPPRCFPGAFGCSFAGPSKPMSDIFHEQLQTLRAQSLHRKLREIGRGPGSGSCRWSGIS